jgi:nitroreductase/dihydropteridine reductase
MEFINIIMQRYATKKFDRRRLDDVKIGQLFEMIRYAPSGLNLQPWKVKVVTDQKVKEELFPVSWNQEQITTCSHLLVFCADTNLEGLVARLEDLMRKNRVPEEKVQEWKGFASGMLSGMTPDQRLRFAETNVYIALANALNGAKALGFDSCPMGAFDPVAYSRILGLPIHLIPVVLCPVGYAADTPIPKMRFPREVIFF